MGRITRYLILGILGGLLGWAIAEPIEYLTPTGNPTFSYPQMLALGAVIGLFLGLALGFAEAMSGVSPRDALKSIIIGAVVGMCGGALGLAIGNTLYGPIVHITGDPLSSAGDSTVSFIGVIFWMFGRTLGWSFFGLFLGISQGLSTESPKKMTNGAIGGFIGGGIGGFVFAMLALMGKSKVIAYPPEMLRLVAFAITGGAIGLFIGSIEELTKKAWIVHLKGRNEGKEFQVFKEETVAGRSELVDISIFGDPEIEPKHFVIKADHKRHLLQDLGTSAGTYLNGQKVTQPQLLKDGDVIQIGMTKLLFREKATQTATSGTANIYGTGAHIPTNDRICPFCGSIKDASGNCSCSAGVSGPPPQAGQSMGATQMQTVYQQPPMQPGQPTQSMQPTQGMTQGMIPTQAIPSQGQSGPFGDPFGAAPGMGGGPKLVAISGPYSGQAFSLIGVPEVTIGRQSDRIISLSMDNTVSRQHARVVKEGGRFVVYDMGSANGTFVNNSKIGQHPLSVGDIVQVGSTKLRYEE